MDKVKNHNNLKKCRKTGAIVNVDKDAYDNYMKQREAILQKNDRLFTIESELQELKNQMKNIIKHIGGINGKG